MVKRILYLLIVLLFISTTAAASTMYELASVQGTDKVTVTGVTDSRFVAANDNIISQISIYGPSSANSATLNISTPDYNVVYSIVKTSGYFKPVYTETMSLYRLGSLVTTSESSYNGYFSSGTYINVEITDTGIRGVNTSLYINILPTPDITVTSSVSTRVKLTVVSSSELQKQNLKDKLNALFFMLYTLINYVYPDSDSALLSIMYFISSIMDFVVAIIWISITNTYLVVVWVEASFLFYAGWRNNSIRGFLDNLIRWNKNTATTIFAAAKSLLELLRQTISLIPGLG